MPKTSTFSEEFAPTVVVDIDGTIFEYEKYVHNQWGEILPDAKDMLDQIAVKFRIILFTARGEDEREGLTCHLAKYDIPYTELRMNKPIADYYIDDRGWRFKDWKSTGREVLCV